MSTPCFAYGSNLLVERLSRHAPSARLLGVGALPGWRRVFHLRSHDGSAKADLVSGHPAEMTVEGALYEIDPSERPALDAWEGLGTMYRERLAVVRTPAGDVEACFYAGIEDRIDSSLRPYDWYLASVIAGARRLGLGSGTLAELAATPSWEDPDSERAGRNWAMIPEALR